MKSRTVWTSWLSRAVAVLVTASALVARGAAPPVEPGFTVRSWDSEDGLPTARFNALARTPDGYLWIATEIGLVRFDGARFVTLTTNTVPALGHNHILSLLVDTNGVLWVGTAAGTLAARAAGSFSAVPLDARLRGAPITRLASGADGALWLAPAGHGLVRWRGGCDFLIPVNGLPPASGIASFVAEPGGRIWAHIDDALMSWGDGVWRRERFDLDPKASVYAMVPDRRGEGLWLALTAPNPLPRRGARIFKMEQGRLVQELQPYPWSQDSKRAEVTTMLQDRRGRLWVGTWVNGVFYWEAGHGWRQPKPDQPTPWHPVDALAEDEDGRIWMVTRDGGLYRIAERKVTALTPPEEAGRIMINSACVTRDGSIWVATDDAGVFRYQEGRFEQFTNGLASIHIGVLLEDSHTNLWAGTQQGLHVWHGARFRPVLGTDSAGFEVYSLYEDSHGNLWGNSNNRGLFRRTPEGEVHYYGREEGLDGYFIRAITEDAEGRLCLAVYQRGFYRLVGEKFERFTVERWPDLRFIHGLCADPAGGVWIATGGAGLFFFKDGQFRQWTSADGLPDMLLRAVVPDDEGNLWFSSNKGIFGCSREALKKHDPGRSSPVLFWRLSVRDGLPVKLASGAGQPVAARSADGRLWFPNYRALAGFDPAVVRDAGRALTPMIEEVRADGIECLPDPTAGLHLRSGVRRIEIHYTCADLRAPERLRFQYQLDGIDDRPREAGAQRVAVYGPLPPGHYRFRVWAGGASSEWREAPEALPLIILPRWWERASVRFSAVLLCVLLSGGTVWLVARARHRRKLARLQLQQVREAERRRIARDIHDDLGATLTRMLWLGEMSGNPETAQAHMHKVATAARDMSQSLEAIVWAVRPENDTLRSLVLYLGRRMDELFEGTSTAYRFLAPHDTPGAHGLRGGPA